MEIVKEIKEFLIKAKKAFSLKDLFLFESSNGYVLASTQETESFDIDSLGSLTSGSITALEQLFSLFGGSSLQLQIIKSEANTYLFLHIVDNYFLFVAASGDAPSGFLKHKCESLKEKLTDYISTFNQTNQMEISDIDIDDITEQLDSQFDILFNE